MFCLELVQWCEHDLYCLCMLQFHSKVFVSRFLLYMNASEIWDIQTTKRVERFRHCGRQVSAEKLRVLAMKVKKVVLVYISIYHLEEYILQGLVKSSWSRRQWKVGHSPQTSNMPVHYRSVERSFGVTNIRVFKPKVELPLLLSIDRTIQTTLVCGSDGVRMLDMLLIMPVICLTCHHKF
jgi:hypothetical protein